MPKIAMSNTYAVKLILWLATLMSCASSIGQTDPATNFNDPVEAQAREALAAKKYESVMDLYEPHLGCSTLPALSHYRYAIAAKNLGRFPQAFASLEVAMIKDPSGSFASETSRLNSLRDQINDGCQRSGGCAQQSAPTEPKKTDLPEQGKAVVTEVGVDPPSTTTEADGPAIQPQLESPPSVTASSTQLATPAPPPSHVAPLDRAKDQWAYLTGAIVLILALSFAWLHVRRRRQDNSLVVLTKELDELALQLAGVIDLLSRARPESALRTQLADVKTLLDTETSRLRYQQTRRASDLALVDANRLQRSIELAANPVNVLVATPQEIEAAFTTGQWQPIFNRS